MHFEGKFMAALVMMPAVLTQTAASAYKAASVDFACAINFTIRAKRLPGGYVKKDNTNSFRNVLSWAAAFR